MHEGLNRGDIDDPPSGLAQWLEKGVRDIEYTIKVDGHDVLPILEDRGGLRGKGIAAVDAGVIDEDRDLANGFGDVRRHAAAGLGHADIEPETPGRAAGTFDRGRRLPGR